MPYTHMQDRECTDSISCPMLITWGAEGDTGIFGINRERSETDASLIVSSSPAEFEGKSCIPGKKKNQTYQNIGIKRPFHMFRNKSHFLD